MNPSQPQTPPTQRLKGAIERITFQNEDNAFTVAKLIPAGQRSEVTIIGKMVGVHVGELVSLSGSWIKNPEYGQQFEVHSYTVELPATVEGIRKYLGSGLIKGIGPVFARRIVDHFKAATLEIIENHSERLMEVEGLGNKRVAMIGQAWESQKQIKEIMLFLYGHGVSTLLAVKIFHQYADQSINVITQDPYRMARDIYGIGFKTADKIAMQIGIQADAPSRIQAGLLYAMGAISDEGHCFALRDQLLGQAQKLLEVGLPNCAQELDVLITTQDLITEDEAIYLPPFYHAEQATADKLREMLSSHLDRLEKLKVQGWEEVLSMLDNTESIRLTDEQKAAVRTTLTQKVSVITGGPGTGKSTILSTIASILRKLGGSVLLAAPTGRAAKRLSELTDCKAKTIHRLLEYSPIARTRFVRDRENPLDSDLIIIDETSMVDILLIHHLLNAIENGSHLLLVGDVDQLPSVGPGNVLRDLIASGSIPVTRLQTIFRQEKDSYIVLNAHNINQGKQPVFPKNASDFFLFPAEEAEKAAEWVLDVVTNRIPNRFGFNPRTDIQVLCPMHRGAAGVGELNLRLQEALNPPADSKPEVRRMHNILFRQGDRVMQIRNDYERLVFNGDMGWISLINPEDQVLQVHMDDREVSYEFSQLDELVHAYAISIHKSQGSEYPVVVVPLLTQHYMMLQRNLVYTAVTRARKLVVLIGNQKAMAIAVRNNRIAQRNTRLAQKLKVTGLREVVRY
ncbi:MAG: ATP-dependent RecD-like DNA helicase [Leptolinea sp.]